MSAWFCDDDMLSAMTAAALYGPNGPVKWDPTFLRRVAGTSDDDEAVAAFMVGLRNENILSLEYRYEQDRGMLEPQPWMTKARRLSIELDDAEVEHDGL